MTRWTAWTAEWSERLIELHAMKHSGGMIAESLTAEFRRMFTRSAVISRIKRLKLGVVGYGQRPPILYPPRKPYKQDRVFTPGSEKRELPSEPIPIHRCTFLELTNNTCRWPVGEGPAIFFCGGPSDLSERKPYCQWHTKIAHNRKPERPITLYKMRAA